MFELSLRSIRSARLKRDVMRLFLLNDVVLQSLLQLSRRDTSRLYILHNHTVAIPSHGVRG